jgi:hypothetical protein
MGHTRAICGVIKRRRAALDERARRHQRLADLSALRGTSYGLVISMR